MYMCVFWGIFGPTCLWLNSVSYTKNHMYHSNKNNAFTYWISLDLIHSVFNIENKIKTLLPGGLNTKYRNIPLNAIFDGSSLGLHTVLWTA